MSKMDYKYQVPADFVMQVRLDTYTNTSPRTMLRITHIPTGVVVSDSSEEGQFRMGRRLMQELYKEVVNRYGVEYNWIFCAGNRRSGTTVHYHYVRELVEHANIGRGYGAVPGGAIGSKPWNILDFKYDPGVKVWRSHIFTQEIRDVLAKHTDVKIVYIHRDMRDCLVSIINHEPRKKFSWFMNGWINDNIRTENQWLGTKCSTLMTKYEEMISDPISEIKRLRNFLDLDGVVGDDFVQTLQEKYSIERVKDENEDSNISADFYQPVDHTESGWAVGDGGLRPFSRNHIHNGSWGQFLDALTEEEILKLESKCGANLVNRGYPLYAELKT